MRQTAHQITKRIIITIFKNKTLEKVVYFLFLDFYIPPISNRRIKHERTSEENVYVSS
jgi:hypothetical protein